MAWEVWDDPVIDTVGHVQRCEFLREGRVPDCVEGLAEIQGNHDHVWVGTEHVGYRLKQRNESGRGWASLRVGKRTGPRKTTLEENIIIIL